MTIFNKRPFKVDARSCASGKTLDTIYPTIRYNISHEIQTLVVVHSVDLCAQYGRKFPTMTVINSTIIDGAVRSTIKALSENNPLICITYQCFLMMDYHWNRHNYHLIIDEAFGGVYLSSVITNKIHQLNWPAVYVSKPDNGLDEFIELELIYDNSSQDDNTVSGSVLYQQITNKNYTHYCSPHDFDLMMNYNNKKVFTIYSLLNQRVYNGWKDIHIAAAAFEKTTMYHMLVKYGITMYTIQNKHFEPHDANIHYHTMCDTKHDNGWFNWSKTKQEKYPLLLETMHNHISNHASGKVLTIRNKKQDKNLGDNEFKLSHNVHGINDENYMSSYDCYMEAALVPSNNLKSFLLEHVLNYLPGNDRMDALIHMHSVYNFYQSIMRCALRDRNYNKQVVNIFTMDTRASLLLQYYFTGTITETWIPVPDNYKPTAKTKTKAEKNKEYYEKKKSIDTKEKKVPLTPAERQQKSRERKKLKLEEMKNMINLLKK